MDWGYAKGLWVWGGAGRVEQRRLREGGGDGLAYPNVPFRGPR